MNQVEYTLLIQKIFLISTSLSFFGLCSILVFLDPYDNSLYIWAFLLLAWLLLIGIITLIVFWWYFGYKKQILSIPQVNSIIYQSTVTAVVAITLIVLNQTNQLNLVTTGTVGCVYLLYWLWFSSRESKH